MYTARDLNGKGTRKNRLQATHRSMVLLLSLSPASLSEEPNRSMTEGIRKLKAKHMRHCVADFAWQLRYIPAGILLDLGFLVSFLLNGREKERERDALISCDPHRKRARESDSKKISTGFMLSSKPTGCARRILSEQAAAKPSECAYLFIPLFLYVFDLPCRHGK